MIKNNKGFTLIELLVVIAIIGVLASVVLAVVNTARAKAADAAIKANFSGIRTNASQYYDSNGNYGTNVQTSDCTAGMFADNIIDNAIDAAVLASGGVAVCVSDASDGVSANADSWAISVPLKTNSAVSWCVDSGGKAQEGTAGITSNVAACS